MSQCHILARMWDDECPKSCSDRQRYYLDYASRLARKSTMTHKHGAIIVIKDTIISTGYNQTFEHMCHRHSIHAEVDAISKVKSKSLNEAELYVVRIGCKSMEFPLKYSKPCCDCQKVIEKYGVGKVFYSTNYEYDMVVKQQLSSS